MGVLKLTKFTTNTHICTFFHDFCYDLSARIIFCNDTDKIEIKTPHVWKLLSVLCITGENLPASRIMAWYSKNKITFFIHGNLYILKYKHFHELNISAFDVISLNNPFLNFESLFFSMLSYLKKDIKCEVSGR